MRPRVEKDLIVRIRRSLKGKGTINVSKGQEVTPADIIGSCHISSGFRTLNLAALLSVTPKEVTKYLVRSMGQKIYKGELLAKKGGTLFAGEKIVTSPTDGILDFLNSETGDLRLTFLSKKLELPAGVYGIVESVDPARGRVIIRTQASIVYGMFGTGRVRDGIMRIIGKRDELIIRSLISDKLTEQIIVGGSLVFKDAISAAISAGASGIITGGINAKDYKAMAGGRLVFPKKLENDIGISLIICEGFGSIPIGLDIADVLRGYDGKFVAIDGNSGVISLPSFASSSLIRVRKSALAPIQDDRLYDEKGANRLLDLSEGCKVRVIGASFIGEQGTLKAIDQTETLLPSGIKTFMVTIETRARKIKVPVANCEVIV